jgi:hypothetical protein
MGYWNSIKLNSRKVSQLSLQDVFLILEAWFALVFFNLALHRVPLQRLQGESRIHPVNYRSATPAHISRMVSMAARLHPWVNMTCLMRALALRWMLGRRGIPTVLCLGVMKDKGNLQGHAWLEIDGAPLSEPPDRLHGYCVLSNG